MTVDEFMKSDLKKEMDNELDRLIKMKPRVSMDELDKVICRHLGIPDPIYEGPMDDQILGWDEFPK